MKNYVHSLRVFLEAGVLDVPILRKSEMATVTHALIMVDCTVLFVGLSLRKLYLVWNTPTRVWVGTSSGNHIMLICQILCC